MDSDDSLDDILPEANVFTTAVDDIWNETLKAYEGLTYKSETSDLSSTNEKATTSEEVKVSSLRRSKRTAVLSKICPKAIKKRSKPPKEPKMSEEDYLKSLEEMLSQNKTGLSAAAKRRIKKQEMKIEVENRRVARETSQTLIMAEKSLTLMQKEIECVNVDDPIENVKLKFSYEGDIKRIIVSEIEPFKTIFKEVAELFQLKPSEIILCRGDDNIKLTDTPKSLDLRIYDMIEVLPCVPIEANKILVKIQSNDTRKRTELRIDKMEKMEQIMNSYAQLRKLNFHDLVFKFDGDRIIGQETPVDLDMESGSVIDVTVLSYKPPVYIEPIEEIQAVPPNEMLDIIEID